MPLVDLYLKFIKIETIVQTIVNISISIEPTNFILGTNIQYQVHLIVSLQVTLADAEDNR